MFSTVKKRKKKVERRSRKKEGGGEWAEPMVSLPCSIGPEDTPGKIILASQCLKRVQLEVKIKQNSKPN